MSKVYYCPFLEELEQRRLLDAAPPPVVSYHGGPILPQVDIHAVFLGQQWAGLQDPVSGDNLESELTGFLKHLVGTSSTWIDFLSQQYSVPGSKIVYGNVENQNSINGGEPYGPVPSPSSYNLPSGTTLDEGQLVLDINQFTTASDFPSLPPPGIPLYVVFLPPGVQTNHTDPLSGQTISSPGSFVGYHYFFNAQYFDRVTGQIQGPKTYYAAITYQQPDANPLATLTTIASHEIAEAITDPEPQSNATFKEQIFGVTLTTEHESYGDAAWTDASGKEIGDLAESSYTHVRDTGSFGSYVIQYLWANKYTTETFGNQALTTYNQPMLPPDVALSLAGSSNLDMELTSIAAPASPTFSGAIATFSDGRGVTTDPSKYSATIEWGDGSTSSGTTGPLDPTTGEYTITASHNYGLMTGKSFEIDVTVKGPSEGSTSLFKTVNAFPVAGDDVYVLSPQGTSAVSAAQGLLANDSDPNGAALHFNHGPPPSNGTLYVQSDGSFTYTPHASFPGFDQITYTNSNGSAISNVASVTFLSPTAGIVWKFYEAMLDRTPEDQGLAYWIGQFNNGVPLSQIAVNFFAGSELQTRIITDYYLQYLGRQPELTGLNYWKAQWTAQGGPEDVQAGFANSPEFTAQNGNTPSGWVTGLYLKILDRPAEPSGLNWWVTQVEQFDAQDGESFVADAAAREKVAAAILKSQEEYQSIIVPGWFEQFVQRQPTATELAQYVNELLAGTPDRTVEEQIIDQAGAAADVPSPTLGTAASLPNFYYVPLVEQTHAAMSSSVSNDASVNANNGLSLGQAGIAAKDVLFTGMGA